MDEYNKYKEMVDNIHILNDVLKMLKRMELVPGYDKDLLAQLQDVYRTNRLRETEDIKEVFMKVINEYYNMNEEGVVMDETNKITESKLVEDKTLLTTEVAYDEDYMRERYNEYVEETGDENLTFDQYVEQNMDSEIEAQGQAVQMDLEEFVFPMIEKQANEVIIFTGTVGRWNGTFDEGNIIKNDYDEFLDILAEYDNVEIKSNDENQIYINLYHHDGTHTMYLYTLPEEDNWLKLAKACGYDDMDLDDDEILSDFSYDVCNNNLDYEVISEHKDMLIPIKNIDNVEESLNESKLVEADNVDDILDDYNDIDDEPVEEFDEVELEEPVEEIDTEGKTTLDYLQDRIDQEITVGELNTILQSLFSRYNEVFLLASDLYNMDWEEQQELDVVDDDDLYVILYDIVDVMDGTIKITDVHIR